ncbi:hypothetical protein Hanom_Chr01g00058141 [Helianthus anomalus]
MTSFVQTHLHGCPSLAIWGTDVFRMFVHVWFGPSLRVVSGPGYVSSSATLDKFVQEYRIPLDLNPVLPSKNEIIYPFRHGKFPLYIRVCNFANYRVPFSKFLIRVLRYFRVHLCQLNPFGLSRINHFEFSCRAQDQRPDLDVFRYFYEFITASDW